MTNSRLPGFYKQELEKRLKAIAKQGGLTEDEQSILLGATGLDSKQADQMIENAVGVFGLPLGIAANFQINGRDVLIPMAIEEP